MPRPDSEAEGVQIVILGNFNPAIFSPGWLLANDLIRRDDYEQAATQVIVPQLSVFSTAWLRCEATPQRLVVGTEQPLEFERVRDIAVSILSLLSHTPINMVGINRYFHVRAEENVWHRIGDRLTPKEIWDTALRVPGMQDVTIRAQRPDAFAGQINVTVQPSSITRPGIYLMQNDHFVLKEVSRPIEHREDFFDPELVEEHQAPAPNMDRIPIARRILSEYWQSSMERAEELLSVVWSIGGQL